MKRIYFMVISWVILITLLVGCGSNTSNAGTSLDETNADASVLQEIQLNSDDEFEMSITKDFIEKFVEVDYKTFYNPDTDKIVVDYIAPDSTSSFTEEQFGIRYYSVRDIKGSEVGYLVACMEEVAWFLWGEFDIGFRPTVFSGFHYSDNESNATEYNCFYGFGYKTNMNDDEYGDIYYYDKIAAQSVNDINVTAGAPIRASLFGSEKDPKDPRPIYEWQDQQCSLAYAAYAETRLHFNGDPIDLNSQIVQPPAEWKEMPLHKCINCGGTARLASGAWCCDNCAAVYGEEDFAEKVSLDTFAEGTWWDTYSQRCNLTIDVIDKESIAIEINWSSSSSENRKWIITAKWDSYWGLMRYENGIKQNINDADVTEAYEDGSGFFYINSGNLYWVDYKESAGFDCVFEFPVY